MVNMIIPPLCPDRIISQWHFEGGGFVALVSFGKRDTPELLDAIQQMIDLKRAELQNQPRSFKAAQNFAESNPAVTLDCAGADTAPEERQRTA